MISLHEHEMINKHTVNEVSTQVFDEAKKVIVQYHRIQESRTMRMTIPESFVTEDDENGC